MLPRRQRDSSAQVKYKHLGILAMSQFKRAILVFDQGKIVQDGNHQALSQVPGMYQNLWKKQFVGFGGGLDLGGVEFDLNDRVDGVGAVHLRPLGRGERLADILAARTTATEGVATAPALVARAAGVDMPICSAVAAFLAGRTTLAQAMADLLARPRRDE